MREALLHWKRVHKDNIYIYIYKELQDIVWERPLVNCAWNASSHSAGGTSLLALHCKIASLDHRVEESRKSAPCSRPTSLPLSVSVDTVSKLTLKRRSRTSVGGTHSSCSPMLEKAVSPIEDLFQPGSVYVYCTNLSPRCYVIKKVG